MAQKWALKAQQLYIHFPDRFEMTPRAVSTHQINPLF